MFYIHQSTCISPQDTFSGNKIMGSTITDLHQPVNNILYAREPAYEGIPPGILRRMGRAVRLGVGAAIPLVKNAVKQPDGIVIGTSMGGMEDCVKFLFQIIEYNEGTLTPTNFVQSTPNAIAGQLGLMSKNNGYNTTHVHRGFSFENAVIDVGMLIKEYPGNSYLLGAVDEISGYNHNIERLAGWYKSQPCTSDELYKSGSPGSIAGEGSSMFIVNGDVENAIAHLKAVHIFQTEDEALVASQMKEFLNRYFPGNEKPSLFLSGENGDNRVENVYSTCEKLLTDEVPVARFKHICGEHPTASAFGCWIACEIIKENSLPLHMVKCGEIETIKSILIYNIYQGRQHSIMLLERP